MKRRALLAGLTLFATPAAAAEDVTLEVASASVVVDGMTGQPVLRLTFSRRGRRALSEFTGRHVGQIVDILVGDAVVTSPVVREPLTGASATIGGTLPEAELRDMARRIASGEAPVRMRAR